MSQLNEDNLEKAFKELREHLDRAALGALKNAQNMGYGFLIIRRSKKGYTGFEIKNALWVEVDEALNALGARGGVIRSKD
jgi:hypothetical protein